MSFELGSGTLQSTLIERIKRLLPPNCGFTLAWSCNPDGWPGGWQVRLFPPNAIVKTALLERIGTVSMAVQAFLPLESVQFGDDPPIPLASLAELAEREDGIPSTPVEEQWAWEVAAANLALANAAIALLAHHGSVFVLDSQGQYLRVFLSQNATPPCAPKEMIGRTVKSVMGIEAHTCLVNAVQTAIETGRSVPVEYCGLVRGELRTYRGIVAPIADTPWGIVQVSRIA